MSKPLILSVVCGQAPARIVESHGHYLEWFHSQMDDRVELVPWVVQNEYQQPPLSDYAGVLITGSPASLTAPAPWMEIVVETIREAAETNVPVLGVCFGHQLVGCAYGAPTTKSPGEGELGSLPIELSEAGREDQLFKDCPPTFNAHFAHLDQVDPEAIAYSNGLRVLASSENTQVQALAGGDCIRSVQFHPEFTQKIMASYLVEEGAASGVSEECSYASKVLHNWLDGWIFKS